MLFVHFGGRRIICSKQGSPARLFGHMPSAATLKKKDQSALSEVCGRQIATQARVAPLREVIATGRRGPIFWSRSVKQHATPSKIFPLEALQKKYIGCPSPAFRGGRRHKVLSSPAVRTAYCRSSPQRRSPSSFNLSVSTERISRCRPPTQGAHTVQNWELK